METVQKIAATYIGQRELPGHVGFESKEFENDMLAAGWKAPFLWCHYFAKLVLLEYYEQDPVLKYNVGLLFRDKVTDTFAALNESDLFTVNRTPQPGAIAFYKWHGIAKEESGTALIVTEVGDTFFSTIELHYKGKVLEVIKSQRKKNRPFARVGLNIMGFVHPIKLTQ